MIYDPEGILGTIRPSAPVYVWLCSGLTKPWRICSARRDYGEFDQLEDAAEFGMGFRRTVDKHGEHARELLEKLKGDVGAELAGQILAGQIIASRSSDC